jgi:two-component system chemotaxis response regulator CheB
VHAANDAARILICEDSRTFATGLKRFLERDDRLRVVEIAVTGEDALRAMPKLRPDLVTMDLELPGMDGIEATRRILAQYPVPIVVVSSYTRRGSERAAGALAAGAVDVLAKSLVRLDLPEGPASVALRHRLRRLARGGAAIRVRPVLPQTHAPGGSRSVTDGGWRRRARSSVVAIGASTGGPQALREVLSPLPVGYGLPVLVVQHMSAGFTPGLARWLDQQLPVPVAMAREGEPLRPGVWFAPEGAHLVLGDSLRMTLDSNGEPSVHRPSADSLLSSVARAAGSGAVGVILTGMGRDGSAGIAAVRGAGGLTIAQDEASSVVWGMPRAAAEAGAELVLPLSEIGSALVALAQQRDRT